MKSTLNSKDYVTFTRRFVKETVDKFYAKIEKAKAKQPTMEWD